MGRDPSSSCCGIAQTWGRCRPMLGTPRLAPALKPRVRPKVLQRSGVSRGVCSDKGANGGSTRAATEELPAEHQSSKSCVAARVPLRIRSSILANLWQPQSLGAARRLRARRRCRRHSAENGGASPSTALPPSTHHPPSAALVVASAASTRPSPRRLTFRGRGGLLPGGVAGVGVLALAPEAAMAAEKEDARRPAEPARLRLATQEPHMTHPAQAMHIAEQATPFFETAWPGAGE